MTNLKYRILVIVALIIASVWALFPRTTIERVKRNGVFVYDTIERVPLKKGLDLQGGMYLALSVDESKGAVANKTDALDRALKVVRSRIDEFGVSEPVVQKAGADRIIVELPGIDDPQRAEQVVQDQAFLQFMITDKSGALTRALPRLDQVVRDLGAEAAFGGDTTLKSAVSSQAGLQQLFGEKKDSTQKSDTSRKDTTTVPGLNATNGPISSIVRDGQMPGEYLVSEADVPKAEHYFSLPQVQAVLPPGKVIRWGSDSISAAGVVYKPFYVLDARAIMTGDMLTDARPNNSPTEGTIVEFTLSNEGGRRFRSETAKHIQDYMAIVLDDKVMGRPPIIQSAIGTRGQITMGRRDLQEAQDLALVLRAGALPVPLKVEEVRNIGASLGADSIARGTRALAVSMLVVVVIMLVYYRFSGALAVMALALYVLFTMAVLAGFGAVLTLPGLAGLVLSVGMAVDANVLIFERIREEMDRGKTVRTSIDEGFRHALSAIIDTSITTILTASVLYQYGTGAVRGFAVTLIAGITASLFCAIFVVRTFYLIWLNRARSAQTLSI
jgi:preprotein translocase subunit SecD